MRALESVAQQEAVRVEHLVVCDECAYLADSRERDRLTNRFPNTRFIYVAKHTHRDVPQDYLPSRLAYLRNLGISHAHADLIAHLDDDNAYRPGHLAGLVDALMKSPSAQVVHSWRRLLTEDGTPFVLQTEDPWTPTAGRRIDSFNHFARYGVFKAGSSIVRDRLILGDRRLGRIDTSELLVRRSLHDTLRFPTTYSPARQKLGVSEDLAFCLELVRRRIKVICSETASIDYYMGGYSNVDALL